MDNIDKCIALVEPHIRDQGYGWVFQQLLAILNDMKEEEDAI